MTTSAESSKASSANLSIHIFGCGTGESIVVETPHGWGVVDCYSPSASDPTQNPTLQFLKRKGVTKLEFVCLTHPHDDHFRGMHQLLEAFEVERFWRCAALTDADLKRLVMLRMAQLAQDETTEMEAARGESPHKEAAQVDEMYRIIELLKSKKTRMQRLENQAPIYPLPVRVGGASDERRPFEIWSIGPSSARAQEYCESLRRCFNACGAFGVHDPKSPRHNEISVALLLRYGETKVLLGGDTERDNWHHILRGVEASDLSVHLVKVSHHGARSGYSDDLWPTLSSAKAKPPVAVLAPSTRHGLPNEDAIIHIQEHASGVFSTSLDAVKCRRDDSLPAGVDPQRVAKIKRAKGIRKYRGARSTDKLEGCTFSFDDRGTVHAPTFHGSGGLL